MKLNKDFFKEHGKQINAGIAGLAAGLAINMGITRIEFNYHSDTLKDQTRTITTDTTYTKTGEIETIKSDTVYVLKENDFDILKP